MSIVDEMRTQLDAYWKWLRDNTELKAEGKDWAVITTPFLDRHNDFIEIYVRRDRDGFLLTDAGEIINDLKMSGCDLSPSRRSMIDVTLRGFGVRLEDETDLVVRASSHDFGAKKHMLIQAMLSVDDLFYTAAPSKNGNIFSADVSDWLHKSKIRYIPRVGLAGVSGYTHYMDFVIPACDPAPERILKLANSPDKNTIQLAAFSWIDIKNSRDSVSKFFVVMNDQKKIPEGTQQALKQYGITAVPWSERESFTEELSA